MALYQMIFSPTGGVAACTEALAAAWEGPWQTVDLTDRGADRSSLAFTAEDLVLAAVPVYAGRVPAPAAERIARLRGNGAAAVALAVYGNRAFEDALLELEDVLLAAGFRCLAGVAALAEHSIARQVAAGRPDERPHPYIISLIREFTQDLHFTDAVDIPGLVEPVYHESVHLTVE